MIFNLFKSKPALRELIPNGFVDIHSHILPNVDDGAKDIIESKTLIKNMRELGFSKIIGTPHTYTGLYNNNYDTINNSFLELKKNLKNCSQISFASEYMLEEELIEKTRNKNLLCLKDNFVLVEMSYISAPMNLYEIIYEIKVNGYKPILAHPERYMFYKNNFKEYYKLKKYGCLFQGNLLSFTGYYGSLVSRISEKLLNYNLFDFVGSDIHKISHIKAFNEKININNISELEKIISKNIEFFGD